MILDAEQNKYFRYHRKMCREREVIESSFRTQMKMYFFVAVKASDDFKYFVANNVFFVELQKIY